MRENKSDKRRVWVMTPARRKALDRRMERTRAAKKQKKELKRSSDDEPRRRKTSPLEIRFKDPLVVMTGSKSGLPRLERVIGIKLIVA